MEIVEGIRSPFPERRRVEDLRSPSPRTRPHLGFVRYECYLVPALLLVVLAVVVPEAHNHGWKGALVALAQSDLKRLIAYSWPASPPCWPRGSGSWWEAPG